MWLGYLMTVLYDSLCCREQSSARWDNLMHYVHWQSIQALEAIQTNQPRYQPNSKHHMEKRAGPLIAVGTEKNLTKYYFSRFRRQFRRDEVFPPSFQSSTCTSKNTGCCFSTFVLFQIPFLHPISLHFNQEWSLGERSSVPRSCYII